MTSWCLLKKGVFFQCQNHIKVEVNWGKIQNNKIVAWGNTKKTTQAFDKEFAESHLKSRSLYLPLSKLKNIRDEEARQSLKGFEKHCSNDWRYMRCLTTCFTFIAIGKLGWNIISVLHSAKNAKHWKAEKNIFLHWCVEIDVSMRNLFKLTCQ